MKTEQARAGEFLLSEAESGRSRKQGTVTGGNYAAGTLMGQLADGRVTALNLTGEDGSQNVVGALYAGVNASEEDLPGVLVDLDAQFIDELLVWPEGVDDAGRAVVEAALLNKGIKVRSGSF